MTNTRYRNTYIDGCSHFCTASVVAFIPSLADERLRHTILRTWERQRTRWGVLIEGFVIMPDHIHILLRGSGEAVRKFMQYSLAETSREISSYLNLRAKAGDVGAIRWLETFADRANGPARFKVWKERFRCVALNQEHAVRVKLEYMHLNPVKRGLAASAEEWKWSSHSHYLGGECELRVDGVVGCGNS